MTEDVREDGEEELRLDKWLWSARFFKTRSAAAEAVRGGQVELNGQKTKPARVIAPGDELRVRRGPFEHRVRVLAVSRQRGPATKAAALYEELPESLAARERLAEQLKLEARTGLRPPPGRPTKKNRRAIVRFKQGAGDPGQG